MASRVGMDPTLVTVKEHGTTYLIPLGGQPVRLNKTASAIWALFFEEKLPLESVIKEYEQRYSCSIRQAELDIQGQLEYWTSIGALKEGDQ